MKFLSGLGGIFAIFACFVALANVRNGAYDLKTTEGINRFAGGFGVWFIVAVICGYLYFSRSWGDSEANSDDENDGQTNPENKSEKT
jgi:hypothetical protein